MSSSHDTSAVRQLPSNFFDSLLFHPFLCPGNFGNRSGLLKYFVHFHSSSFSFYAEDFHASQVSDVRPSLEFIVHGIDLDGNGDADVDRDSYPIGHLNESTPLATNSTSCVHLLLSAPESPGPATQILHPCLSFAPFYF